MHNFWVQNGHFAHTIIFSENLLMSLVPLIHAYLYAKNQSQILIYWWNFDDQTILKSIGWETFLVITWKPDFSQACSFRRMLMNQKNFHFTQIPDKTNGTIFFKSQKTLVFVPFLTIFGHSCTMGIFSKKSSCHTQLYMGP